jgi:hypothetical protein
MTTFPPTTTLFIFFLIFFVATFIKALALKRQKDLFFCKLAEANGFFDELAEELKVIHEKHEKTKQFKTSLTAAELTTQLQKPRLSNQTSPATNSIPEKYSFVHSLIKKNMSSDEIASILAISVHEAAQLVTLSKLGRTQ